MLQYGHAYLVRPQALVVDLELGIIAHLMETAYTRLFVGYGRLDLPMLRLTTFKG